MRLIIFGSRDFDDYELLKKEADYFIIRHLEEGEEVIIVSGEADGADVLGEDYADANGYKVMGFPADWNKYGNAAGGIRNRQMAKYATHAIGFWDGRSPGTRDMIEKCKIYGLKYIVVKKRC